MSTIVPYEIYLLETFSSVAYLAQLRDTWGEMVQHLEQCLDQFMLNLPADYRNRPLPEQPDAVWGERVLPSFRSTYEALCSGVIALSHGDPDGLYSAHHPSNDYMGQREFSDAWLTAVQRERYRELLERASRLAANICATVETFWEPGVLKDPQIYADSVDLPAVLPVYKANSGVTVKTDSLAKHTGVYLSDKENSIPVFIAKGWPAPNATVIVGMEDLLDQDGAKYGEQTDTEDQPCVWTLIERDESATARRSPPALMQVETHRIAGGDVCPASGFYFTPAKVNSRQRFLQGQIMPSLDSTYGGTIWQWDADQS